MSSGKLSIHQPKVKASALSNSIRLLESEMDNIILGTDGRPLAVVGERGVLGFVLAVLTALDKKRHAVSST